MDENEIKHVVEAALLAAGRPLPLDKLGELFTAKGTPIERATLKQAIAALDEDYRGRGIEIGEVASGYRIQVRRAMSDWLTPLWEERAPRYTRALLETLALIAYRQPITRGEIEQVRGVAVSPNIIRTLQERGWVRVVGHRDVPGKPEMFGTTREFLDYFGLKRLEDLPPLAELKDGLADYRQQTDLIESLESAGTPVSVGAGEGAGDEAAAGSDGRAVALASAESEAAADAAAVAEAATEAAETADSETTDSESDVDVLLASTDDDEDEDEDDEDEDEDEDDEDEDEDDE